MRLLKMDYWEAIEACKRYRKYRSYVKDDDTSSYSICNDTGLTISITVSNHDIIFRAIISYKGVDLVIDQRHVASVELCMSHFVLKTICTKSYIWTYPLYGLFGLEPRYVRVVSLFNQASWKAIKMDHSCIPYPVRYQMAIACCSKYKLTHYYVRENDRSYILRNGVYNPVKEYYNAIMFKYYSLGNIEICIKHGPSQPDKIAAFYIQLDNQAVCVNDIENHIVLRVRGRDDYMIHMKDGVMEKLNVLMSK